MQYEKELLANIVCKQSSYWHTWTNTNESYRIHFKLIQLNLNLKSVFLNLYQNSLLVLQQNITKKYFIVARELRSD